MSRLPTPGSDEGSWGTILNDFLAVEHNTDGSLRTDGTLGSYYRLPAGGMPRTDLNSDVQAALNQASNAAQLGSNSPIDLAASSNPGSASSASREDHIHSTNGLALQSDLASYYQFPSGAALLAWLRAAWTSELRSVRGIPPAGNL